MASLKEVWLLRFARRGGFFLVAVLIGVGVYRISTPRPPIDSPRFLVAKRPLKKGLPLRFEDLGFIFENDPPTGALNDQLLFRIRGARLSKDLGSGEILTEQHLERQSRSITAKLPFGFRAYAIQPSNRLPVRVGDIVEVYWNPEKPEESPMLLVEGARVLDATHNFEKWTIVLALAADEIQLMEKAQRTGKLTVAGRSQLEEGHPRSGKRSRNFPFLRKSKRQPKVDVLSGS